MSDQQIQGKRKIINGQSAGRSCLVIGLLLLLSLSIGKIAHAQTPREHGYISYETQSLSTDPIVIVGKDIVVVVQYGFDQQARFGRDLELNVTIYNKAQTMDVVVSAVLMNQEEDNIRYEKDVVLQGYEKTETALTLPMNQTTQSIYFTVKTGKDNTAVETTISLNAMNYGAYYILGIMNDKANTLSYFEGFGNKCVSLDESNIPNDISGLDMLDAIVINHYDLDQLSVRQLLTIIEWVNRGGNLILGVDIDSLSNIELLTKYQVIPLMQPIDYESQDTKAKKIQMLETSEFSSLLTKIKEYELLNARMQQILDDDLKEYPNADLNVYMGKPMLGSQSVNDVKNVPVTKTVTKIEIDSECSSNDISSNDLRLYDKVSYGKGKVQLFYFDLGNDKLNTADLSLYGGVNGELLSGFYADVVLKSMDGFSSKVKNQVTYESGGGSSSYRIDNMNDYMDKINIPKVIGYAIILVIYLLIAGPVTFTILRRKKKQQLLWGILPAVSILFLIIVFLHGFRTRITSPYAAYVNIEYYDLLNRKINGTAYMNLSLPAKNPYSIELLNANTIQKNKKSYPNYYDVNLHPDISQLQFYDANFAATSIRYNEEGAILDISDQAAFQKDPYQIGYESIIQEDLRSEIFLNETQMSGTLTNTSKSTYTDALIYCNGLYVELGRFEPDQTVSLEKCAQVYALSPDNLYSNDNAISRYKNTYDIARNGETGRFINAFAMAYEKYLLSQQGTYFIGFAEDVPKASPIRALAKERASSGESIVIIPLTENTQQDDGIFVPSIDCYLKEEEQALWDQEYRIAYLNSLELEYHFPEQTRISRLLLTNLFSETFDNETYASNTLRIYFYNYKNEKYDLIFDLDSEYTMKSISASDLENYINDRNDMKIKYETRNSDDTLLTIPIVSCVKEVPNAEN